MNEEAEQVKMLCPMCRSEVEADARFCKYCAFSLSASNASRHSSADKKRKAATSRSLFTGVFIFLILAVIALTALFFGAKRNASTGANNPASSASPSPVSVMSAKGLEIEQKILRDERLQASDLEGLTAVELKLLRNAHFARYGRLYMERDLNDYFQSRPWYQASDSFNNNRLTAIDKENVNVIVSVEKSENNYASAPPVTGYAPPDAAPESTPAYQSDNRGLTIDNAQDALNRFVSANGSGQIRIKGGIREIPAQNSAVAELDADDFTDNRGRNYRGKRAAAGFSRYTDGKWSLTEVVIMLNNYFDKTTWKPIIEVR